MTLVVHQSDVGEALREPLALSRRRRRLSTVARQRIPGRPCIVSVHRRGSASLTPTDETVRLRKQWKDTLLGPEDVVVFTYLPLGGGGGQGGGKQIGMAVALIALSVVAPMLVGAMGPAFAVGGSLTLLGKVVSAGIVMGAAYFLSKAVKSKANNDDDRPVYGVSGGGNIPRPGDRIPVHYGKTWSNPDLSQPDYFIYEGEDQVLFKRMTLGLGEYDIHKIRIGAAIMWEDGVLKPPFTTAEVEIIKPNSRSALVPSSVYSSPQVGGVEVARPEDNPAWNGPFPVTPQGITTKTIQLDWSLPYGLYAYNSKGKKVHHVMSIRFEYAQIDDDDNVVGSWMLLHTEDKLLMTTRAQRFTNFITVPEGRYAVRAQMSPRNTYVESVGGSTYDQAMWDGLRSHLDREPRRPEVTEIAMKIRSGKATGNATSFSDIWVEHTRRLPVWDGSSWKVEPTRKAVWAAVDVLRNDDYGNALPDSKIDLPTFLHYARTVTEYDTFDGTIRGPVAVAEALSTILGVIRGEPILLGDFWSMGRDEPRTLRKHVVTRRQIVRDTSGMEFDLDLSDGSSDVIVEYLVDGDPKRRGEQRVTIGAETLTPRRINAFGVSDHAHATMLAKWYAAAAYYRREHRMFSTEMAGRNLQRNDAALIDMWFLDDEQAAGVEKVAGYDVTLDADIDLPAGAHAVFRNEQGLEWGPVAVTATGAPRTITVDSSDASTIYNWTGQSFSSIFGKARRALPVTVLIGTLAELTQPYIIRSARPEAGNRVQISAVYDDPTVWTVLGEPPPPQPPIKEVLLLESDLAPILPWVRAQCVQKATALTLEWAVGEARGAVRYVVDMRYTNDDNAQWERIHNGRASEGTAVIEYRADTEVRVRARAVNGKGVVSEPLYTTVTLFKPVIDADIVDMLVELEMLQEQLRKDIESITKLGRDTLRENLKKLQDRVDELANAAATETSQAYENRELVKVAVGNAFAALEKEINVRISEDEALVEQINTMAAQIDTDISAQLTEESRVRAAEDEALSQRIITLNADLGTTNASLTNEITARVDGDSALAEDITAVSTTVGGHTTTITQHTSSINGIKGEHGVAIEIDGRAVGGYRLTGFRKLDGTFYSQFGIMGDLVVDGTIYGTKLAAANIITASAQIGNAVIKTAHIDDAQILKAKIGDLQVDTLKIANGSITSSWVDSGNIKSGSATLERNVYARGDGRAVAICSFKGLLGTTSYKPNPTFRLFVDGTEKASFASIVTEVPRADGGTDWYANPITWQVVVEGLAAGYRTFSLRTDDPYNSFNCIMTVLEFGR